MSLPFLFFTFQSFHHFTIFSSLSLSLWLSILLPPSCFNGEIRSILPDSLLQPPPPLLCPLHLLPASFSFYASSRINISLIDIRKIFIQLWKNSGVGFSFAIEIASKQIQKNHAITRLSKHNKSVCVCECVCVYWYAYWYTHTNIYIYMYMHIYVYTLTYS